MIGGQVSDSLKFETLTPKSWLKRTRVHTPSYLIIHATRGNNTPAVQYQATKNWMTTSVNQQANFSWGSSCDWIIGNEPGEICKVGRDDQHSSWGAGFGGIGTWGADQHGISIEVAQSASLEEYDVDAIENLLNLCVYLCRQYDIPPVRILHLVQLGVPPRGFVGHEDTANGRKTGKSDPGPKFPWTAFLNTLKKRLDPPPVVADNRYTVRPGDVLGRIATTFNVGVADLVRWNAIVHPDLIEVGDRLWIVEPPLQFSRTQEIAREVRALMDELEKLT